MNVNPGYVPRLFVECLAHSYKALPHMLPIQTYTSAIPNRARTINGLAFLQSEAEWALLLDSDMTWEPGAIIQLTKTAKRKRAKAVSGLTFMEQSGGRIVPHCYDEIPNNQGGKARAAYAVLPTLDQPFKVKAVGGACFLVHRDVYQDVKKITEGMTGYFWQEDRYNPKVGEMEGEDIVFSDRIRTAGYDIWYEPRAPFLHKTKGDILGLPEHIEFLDKAGISHGYQR